MAALVPDDASEDRTHRASVDGQVKASYQGQRGPYEKTIDVSDRTPDSRKTLRIRVHVHLEPFEDTGYSDPASTVPMVGAGNGVFDFKDVNGNGVHDAGELSEPYIDLSRFVPTFDPNGAPLAMQAMPGNVGDNATAPGANGRGPVIDEARVMEEINRSNIGWAQAGIKIEKVGPTIYEDAPSDPATGQNILLDGFFDWQTNAIGFDVAIVIQSIQAATPDVLEVIFSGPLFRQNFAPPSAAVADIGLASIPLVHDPLDPHRENTYVFINPNKSASYKLLAHEIGHALTNQGDTFFTPYIFFPAKFSDTDTHVNFRRRIRHDTQTTARTPRVAGNLTAPGNRLLPP